MAKWTTEELDALSHPWPAFHALFPDRSYDSWEVKRRRVTNAGHGRTAKGHRKHVNTVDCWCGPLVEVVPSLQVVHVER